MVQTILSACPATDLAQIVDVGADARLSYTEHSALPLTPVIEIWQKE
jgi:hypothetical protein